MIRHYHVHFDICDLEVQIPMSSLTSSTAPVLQPSATVQKGSNGIPRSMAFLLHLFKSREFTRFIIVSAVSKPLIGGKDLHLGQDVLEVISRLLYRM